MKEDDTMISVSGILIFLAGHKVEKDTYIYYRCSEEDMFVIEASPCVCVEKWKHSATGGI